MSLEYLDAKKSNRMNLESPDRSKELDIPEKPESKFSCLMSRHPSFGML